MGRGYRLNRCYKCRRIVNQDPVYYQIIKRSKRLQRCRGMKIIKNICSRCYKNDT